MHTFDLFAKERKDIILVRTFDINYQVLFIRSCIPILEDHVLSSNKLCITRIRKVLHYIFQSINALILRRPRHSKEASKTP